MGKLKHESGEMDNAGLGAAWILRSAATARLFAGRIVWQHGTTQMRKLLPLLALAFFGLAGARAAITVGPGGSGGLSFSALPSATEWSTRSLAGTELSFTSAAALDAAVQTNSLATITNTLLDGLGAVPPGQNSFASWSGGGTAALWTRPAANSATLLMATLENSTGEDQTVAGISYTLGQSGPTPAEQIGAHQVYYSFTGAPGSWVKIPALSGGTAGARSLAVALNGVWVKGAPLYVLWADDNTTGGVDRGYSLDDFVFTGRPAPTLEAVPDVIADVGQPVFFHAQGRSTVPGARIIYSLEAGAPAAARINPTNGLFAWKPARADAATTNQITIRAADADAPAAGAAQTFTVVVRDYVELSLSGVVMEGGQRTNVLLECAATSALTNLSVTVLLPTNRLTAPVVENLASSAALLAVDDLQPGRVVLSFAARPGQLLAGTQMLARVNFTAAAEPPSAFVPLRLEGVAAMRERPGLAPGLLLNHGRAVIVNRAPLVEAFTASDARTLVLYGHPGTNYTVESAPGPLGPWQPQASITLESLFTIFDTSASTNAPGNFYRAMEGASLPPAPALSQAGSASPAEKSAKTKKVKKPKKKRISAARRTSPSFVLPQ